MGINGVFDGVFQRRVLTTQRNRTEVTRQTHYGFAVGAQTTSTGGLDASWELDLSGSVRRAAESADALLQARQADWHDARVSLAAEVATNYVTYRACQLTLLATQADARSSQTTADVTLRSL